MTKMLDFKQLLKDAYDHAILTTSGENASYIPELARVNSDYFAIVVSGVDGSIHSIGDADIPFAIESISKVFNLAYALDSFGSEAILTKIGANATGMSFNSVAAIELEQHQAGNALVNAGAIATVSLILSKQQDFDIMANMSRFAGEELDLNKAVCDSEMATNRHNQAIAELLLSYDRLYADPAVAVQKYTRGCSINVSTRQLALMSGVLANEGAHPLTKDKILAPEYVHKILAMMTIAGMYDNSGTWFYRTGVPAKSGVGGGIMAIVPGRFSIAAFSPPLDQYGNSARGQQAIQYLLQQLKIRVM
ncbi:MAG: glutaminase A [Francisellaceae bacterium]